MSGAAPPSVVVGEQRWVPGVQWPQTAAAWPLSSVYCWHVVLPVQAVGAPATPFDPHTATPFSTHEEDPGTQLCEQAPGWIAPEPVVGVVWHVVPVGHAVAFESGSSVNAGVHAWNSPDAVQVPVAPVSKHTGSPQKPLPPTVWQTSPAVTSQATAFPHVPSLPQVWTPPIVHWVAPGVHCETQPGAGVYAGPHVVAVGLQVPGAGHWTATHW
jgi:hypothetical protein